MGGELYPDRQASRIRESDKGKAARESDQGKAAREKRQGKAPTAARRRMEFRNPA
jgi:hypothetical protein